MKYLTKQTLTLISILVVILILILLNLPQHDVGFVNTVYPTGRTVNYTTRLGFKYTKKYLSSIESCSSYNAYQSASYGILAGITTSKVSISRKSDGSCLYTETLERTDKSNNSLQCTFSKQQSKDLSSFLRLAVNRELNQYAIKALVKETLGVEDTNAEIDTTNNLIRDYWDTLILDSNVCSLGGGRPNTTLTNMDGTFDALHRVSGIRPKVAKAKPVYEHHEPVFTDGSGHVVPTENIKKEKKDYEKLKDVCYTLSNGVKVACKNIPGSVNTYKWEDAQCKTLGMRLPTKLELIEIYKNKSKIPDLVPFSPECGWSYWSSSQDGRSAMQIFFSNYKNYIQGTGITLQGLDDIKNAANGRCVKD